MPRTNTQQASLLGRVHALQPSRNFKSAKAAYDACIAFEEFEDTPEARHAFNEAYNDPLDEREEQRRWKIANNAYSPDSTMTDPEANR